MDGCRKLLRMAQAHPQGLRFKELCELAECFGFRLSRRRGSHQIFKHPDSKRLLNLQNSKGMAKAYQVRQLLTALEELDIL